MTCKDCLHYGRCISFAQDYNLYFLWTADAENCKDFEKNLIHCKDCRYYNRRWGCRKLEINVSADNYCFMAELAVADSEVVLSDEK